MTDSPKQPAAYTDMIDYFRDYVREALEIGPDQYPIVRPDFYRLEDSHSVSWGEGCVAVGTYRVFFGSSLGDTVENPTWADLMVEAEKVVRALPTQSQGVWAWYLKGFSGASTPMEQLASAGSSEAALTLILAR
jgi:hypothetical protein